MRVQTMVNDGHGWDLPAGIVDGVSTLVLAFGARTRETDSAWFDELLGAFPSSCIVGCSTSGEILGDRLFDDSVVAAVIEFEQTGVRSATVSTADFADSREAGNELGRRLAGDDLAALLVFAEGAGTNGSALVEGLQESVGGTVPVSGGLAGDGERFETTWVIGNGRLAADQIAVVGLYGDSLQSTYGTGGGWIPFGPERTITASRGNVLEALDGKAALPLYRSYLGELAEGLPASALFFPLCVWPVDGSAEPLVRTVLGTCDETDTMRFAGDVPVGHRAQLMMADPEDLIDAASDAARSSCPEADGTADVPSRLGDAFTLAVSCVGRRLVLGGAADDELLSVTDGLGSSPAVVGFYSYGEISSTRGRAELHNQTMTVTTLREVTR